LVFLERKGSQLLLFCSPDKYQIAVQKLYSQSEHGEVVELEPGIEQKELDKAGGHLLGKWPVQVEHNGAVEEEEKL
jgi:hypothetical protein